ncbi:MAG: aldo/keto reductase [Proteobacteria bacterium]|nr:aldo/keto reductase [Burkholderiales bacterium]
MRQRAFGKFGEVSALALGGAGVASHWGAVARDEGVATLREAVARGVTFLDMAPKYGDLRAEQMVGEAFDGRRPSGVRVLTKVLFDPDEAEFERALETSLAASLARMRLQQVDFLLLHNQVVPDHRAGVWPGVAWTVFAERIRPLLVGLVRDGRVAGWGLSGIGAASQILRALDADSPPDVIEAIANPLDLLGNLHTFDESPRPRDIIARADQVGTAVLGVRVAAAGALTSALDRTLPADHPVAVDFARANGFRAVATKLAMTPALLALRYVLGMPGVASVVLGVKNRVELDESLDAEQAGPLDEDIRRLVDASAIGAPG